MQQKKDFLMVKPQKILQEMSAIAGLLWKSLGNAFTSEDGYRERASASPETILFLHGFLAQGWLYNGVCSDIEAMTGYMLRFHIPHFGTRFMNSNRIPFDEAKERIARIYGEFRPQVVVGHSLGGILGMTLLAPNPDLKAVIAIGSPLYGTRWRLMKALARGFLKFDPDDLPENLAEMRGRIQDVSGRIVTISHRKDWIAPPETCRIRGARNILARDLNHTAHSGMLLSLEVQKLIIDSIYRAIGTFEAQPANKPGASAHAA